MIEDRVLFCYTINKKKLELSNSFCCTFDNVQIMGSKTVLHMHKLWTCKFSNSGGAEYEPDYVHLLLLESGRFRRKYFFSEDDFYLFDSREFSTWVEMAVMLVSFPSRASVVALLSGSGKESVVGICLNLLS